MGGPGKTFWLMACVALMSALVVLSRPVSPRTGIRLWTFTAAETDMLKTLAAERFLKTGDVIHIERLSASVLQMRLMSLSDSEPARTSVPDIVELEIGTAGMFFRGKEAHIGLRPLDDFLNRAGWRSRLHPARLETWSIGGHTYGVPLDVHPVALLYRAGLFDRPDANQSPNAAGIANANERPPETWPQLISAAYVDRSGQRLPRPRFHIEFPENSADVLVMLLMQRGVRLVDAAGANHLDDPRVAQTILFYAGACGTFDGPARSSDRSAGGWLRDLAAGRIDVALVPDWRVDELLIRAPELAGKFSLSPLPVFDPTDAPTSTWGGTMVGIPRACPDPERAWKIIEDLYLSQYACDARARRSIVVSALGGVDALPRSFDNRLATYFVGTSPDIFHTLAGQVPARQVTSLEPLAIAALNRVLGRAIDTVRSGRDQSLQADVTRWLDAAHQQLDAWASRDGG